MDVLIFLFLLLLLGFFIGYKVQGRRRKAEQDSPHRARRPRKEQGRHSLPRFEVVTLGQPGAGKTVFLGSMFHELSIVGSSGLYVTTEVSQRNRLLDLYNQVRDPTRDFPPGTMLAETVEWLFETRVKSRHGSFTAFDFTYLDYAGEHARALFESEDAPLSRVLRQAVERADVLMVMLDGYRVREVLRQPASPSASGTAMVNRFYSDLRAVLGFLSGCDKPVHFVLTKWDLLEGQWTLADVVAGLRANPDFQRFINGQAAVAPLRLIPVSAVGFGFVRESHGQMIKVPDQHMQPFQVDIPLACVLPDIISTRVSTSAGSTGQSPAAGMAGLVRRITPTLGRATQLLKWFEVSFGPVKVNLNPAGVPFNVPRPQPGGAAEVDNQDRAMQLAYRDLVSRTREFTVRFPESDLSLFAHSGN